MCVEVLYLSFLLLYQRAVIWQSEIEYLGEPPDTRKWGLP